MEEAEQVDDVIDDAIRAVALREAIVEAEDPAAVGGLVGVQRGEDAVLVRFAAEVEGYRGWQWSVSVALVDPERPTVSEVVLLPGPEALLAPEWIPWTERIRGGDLAPGDLLPPAPDDARIVPAYVQSDDPAVEELAREIGFGRVRVMSREGRAQAARRWHRGDFGPRSEMARQAPETCATCAFYLPIAGSLGAGFGVCGNEFSPAEGRVVDIEFGCGAHSEARLKPRAQASVADAVLDELRLEVHLREGEDDLAESAAADLDDPAADLDIEVGAEYGESAAGDPAMDAIEAGIDDGVTGGA